MTKKEMMRDVLCGSFAALACIFLVAAGTAIIVGYRASVAQANAAEVVPDDWVDIGHGVSMKKVGDCTVVEAHVLLNQFGSHSTNVSVSCWNRY